MFRLPVKLRRKWTSKRRSKPLRILGFLHYKFDLWCENLFIHHAKIGNNGLNIDKRNQSLVVSLTSFPARIHQTYFAIKSLMIQSYKADRIVLWLSELQFPDKKLPKEFNELISYGLEVRFTEDDLRSHKKYFYMLQEQRPDELVVTVDDDIIYEKDMLKRLIETNLRFPNCIVCDYAPEYFLDEKGIIVPYCQWKVDSEKGVEDPSDWLMPYTGAGCLYPYKVMPDSTFDKEAIIKNAFSADDLWMRFNSLSKGVKVVKTRQSGPILCVVKGSQTINLGTYNSLENGNDNAVANLSKFFPNAINHLRSIRE